MAVVTVEGPLTQLGKKGYPSESRLMSERASHLEVWTNCLMFLVRNNHCSCSVSYYRYFDVKGLLFLCSGYERKFHCIYDNMQSGLVKIISFNVNVVLNPIKRSKILSN